MQLFRVHCTILLYECPHKLFDIFLKSYRVQNFLFLCLGERFELYVEKFVRQELFGFIFIICLFITLMVVTCFYLLLYSTTHLPCRYQQCLLDY